MIRNPGVRSLARLMELSLDVPSEQTFADWCTENLVIPAGESETGGPFTFDTREYMIACVNDYGNMSLEEITNCLGTQLGKTISIMAGTAARLVRRPCKALWVMPNRDLARTFSETRWMPFIDASKTLRDLKPKNRHQFSKGKQVLGNSLIIFQGSNSPANVSSVPASLVNMDEVDKFNEGTKKEANSVDLAEQRTKSFSEFLKVRSSSPTLSTSITWEKYLLGDQQRYFVPCFSCKRHVLFVWDREKTVLPLQGCEAQVQWDKEAKKPDGTWDKERVMKSARLVCPHCGFHILDAHKTWMIRNGEWRATNPFAKANVRSRHLPSLYSCARQMRVGNLAIRWIELLETGRGVQAMVNGELAEPWEAQDTKAKRFEIIVRGDADAVADSVRQLTIDVQLVAPYFWVLTRDWGREGHSRLDLWEPVNSWDDVRQFQLDRGVPDNRVYVDCRHKPAEVFEHCLAFGKRVSLGGPTSTHIGWIPCEGHDRDVMFRDKKTKLPRLFDLRSSQLPHAKFELPKLVFNGPQLKDILANIRKPRVDIRWEVTERATPDYWRHLDSEVKRETSHPRTRRTVYEWQKRSQRWPNHLLDCEVMQLAAAMMNLRFPWALPSQLKPATTEEEKKP